MGEWILREACNQVRAWHQMGLPLITISVNTSPRQFWSAKFDEVVLDTLAETGLAVTVGRRTDVMKNGSHLYRCSLQQPLSASPLAVPARALAEVKGLGWHAPGSLDRENWRFSYQFDLFLDVLNRALQQHNAEPE